MAYQDNRVVYMVSTGEPCFGEWECDTLEKFVEDIRKIRSCFLKKYKVDDRGNLIKFENHDDYISVLDFFIRYSLYKRIMVNDWSKVVELKDGSVWCFYTENSGYDLTAKSVFVVFDNKEQYCEAVKI